MTLSGTVRWIIAVTVTIGLQVCCCNIEAMFRVCIACGDHAAPALADLTHSHDEPASAHHSHDYPTTAEDQHESSPCNDHREQGECTCESHEVAKSLSEKPGLDLPTLALIAVLPEPQFGDPGFVSSPHRWAPTESDFRPPSSLLRQHCALTI